jgi:putative CRISPR-associated protein (TIGR02619 family)
MTLYLCNVGTSASQAVLREPAFRTAYLAGRESAERLDAPLVAHLGGPQAAYEAMAPYFLSYDSQSDADLRKRLSAEVHSLVRLGLGAGDRVVLFFSDTADGAVCARLVEAYLRDRLGIAAEALACQRVPGLQVDDAVRFRREGVPNYFRLALREGERQGWYDVVLINTGGWKALVSYTTLLGMMFGVPVCYIFDNGRELLRLPPLPVEIDRDRLAPLLPAMERVERDTAIPADAFWGRSPHELREKYASLLEDVGGGQVTLSPLGLLVWERLRQVQGARPLAVYLSRAAWDDFVKAPRDWDVAGFLHRLRTVADVDRYRHPTSDSSLWLKPGNTSDRYRVELEGDRLLVYRILPHDEYERAVGRAWPRAQYGPFLRFDVVN